MERKKEIKIGMALDEYKLPEKESWWKIALEKAPYVEQEYDFVREEQKPGLSPGTVMLYRHYKLKEPN